MQYFSGHYFYRISSHLFIRHAFRRSSALGLLFSLKRAFLYSNAGHSIKSKSNIPKIHFSSKTRISLENTGGVVCSCVITLANVTGAYFDCSHSSKVGTRGKWIGGWGRDSSHYRDKFMTPPFPRYARAGVLHGKDQI